MPKPTKTPSRLGTDPFSWIRDTRQDDEQPTDAPAAQPAAQTADIATQPISQPAAQAAAPAQAVPVVTLDPAPTAIPDPTVLLDPAPDAASVVTLDPTPALEDAAPDAAMPPLTLDAQQLAQLASLLQQSAPPARRGRPRTNFREITKASQEGLPENWTRATFIVREELLDNLKDYAYTQRLTIRDVMDQALTQYLRGKQVLRRKR